MDHAYFEDRISAYRDKGLPADEHEMIRRHLEECESCRKLYDRLERFDQLVRDKAELGDDLYWEKAAQKIEQRLGIVETVVTPISRKSVWRGLGWKISAVAASAVLITFIAVNKDRFLNEKQMMAPAPKPMITDTIQAPPVMPEQSLRKAVPVVPTEEPIDEEQIADDKTQEESGRMRKAEPDVNKPASQIKQEKIEKESSAQPGMTRVSPAATTTAVQFEERTAALPSGEDVIDTNSAPENLQTAGLARSPRPDIAADEAMPAIDSIGDMNHAELDRWRAVRDSLEPMLSDRQAKGLFNAVAPNALQQDRRAKGNVAASDESAKRELMYLEAWYQIAQLGQDSAEIRLATDHLRKIADNPESANRDSARVLLDRLMVGK